MATPGHMHVINFANDDVKDGNRNARILEALHDNNMKRRKCNATPDGCVEGTTSLEIGHQFLRDKVAVSAIALLGEIRRSMST
jgi:hypothetical protein